MNTTPTEDARLVVARRVWAALLAGAGAVATLAGFLYFVGALSLWIALRFRDYSADVVIQHQPREQLIGIGLRGAIFLTALAGTLLLLSVLSMRFRRVRKRVRKVARKTRLRKIGVAAVLPLFVASFVSWRYVALAILWSTLLIFTPCTRSSRSLRPALLAS